MFKVFQIPSMPRRQEGKVWKWHWRGSYRFFFWWRAWRALNGVLRKLDSLFAAHFSQPVRLFCQSLTMLAVSVGMWTMPIRMQWQTTLKCQWLKTSNINFLLAVHACRSFCLVLPFFCDPAASCFCPQVMPITVSISLSKAGHMAMPDFKRNRVVQSYHLGRGTWLCRCVKTQYVWLKWVTMTACKHVNNSDLKSKTKTLQYIFQTSGFKNHENHDPNSH